jgi:protein arginine kinase activator
MKKCRRCTKPAVLHITELRNGEAQALHLCEGCAKDYLSNVSPGTPPDDAASESGFPAESTGDESDERDALSCPHCGITFKQFRSQGRLGCPHDYVVFRDELLPLLESIHSETQHVGKVPRHAPGISRTQVDLIRLRGELKAAVQNEQYEAAATLRDQIQQLELSARQEASED